MGKERAKKVSRTVLLDEWQTWAITAIAQEFGQSEAAVLREALTLGLDRVHMISLGTSKPLPLDASVLSNSNKLSTAWVVRHAS